MGMFDEIYDTNGHDWQTKAYGCLLDRFEIGDTMPAVEGDPGAYQVEILGGPFGGTYVDSYATVRGGVLTSVDDPRDEALPLLNYGGGRIES